MKPPLFVELCAGTAALSLALHSGKHARPPVSRMGAKTGYAQAILRVLGLRPGQQAAHYVLCEPDDGVRLLLYSYRDADLAREAARIIRSWAEEEPRALWERLRAEGPARCPPVDAREVARWVSVGQLSYRQMEPASGFNPGMALDAATPCWRPKLPAVSDDLATLRTLPATIHDDATTAPIPDPLPAGTIVYMDPPYVGTTGYAHDLDRAQVVQLARRWKAAGATVAISEACGLAEELGPSWHEVDITQERRGKKRTFSRQQREVLTLSRPPAWTPSVQVALFGAA